MTSIQFKKAAKIGLHEKDTDLSTYATDIFSGFGLRGFKPIFCSVLQLAWLIRWQCAYCFSDGHCDENLQQIAELGRKRFKVID